MAACNFTIPFEGNPDKILTKARLAVQSQGGNFIGDSSAGKFDVSIFGNGIAGSYSIAGQDLEIIIDSKPFMVPCSAIESFLRNQVK